MKKKEYIKPEMNVFKADMQAILAISGNPEEKIMLEFETNYTEEDIKNLWDRDETKTIWAD